MAPSEVLTRQPSLLRSIRSVEQLRRSSMPPSAACCSRCAITWSRVG